MITEKQPTPVVPDSLSDIVLTLPPHVLLMNYQGNIFQGGIPDWLLRHSTGRSIVPSEQPYLGKYHWLKDVRPEATFQHARKNIVDIFGEELIQAFGEAECFRVLERAKLVADHLKRSLKDTSYLSDKRVITKEDVIVLSDTLKDIYPLAYSAENFPVKPWRYPEWDQNNNMPFPQERQFYRSVISHVEIARLYVRELAQVWNSTQLEDSERQQSVNPNELESVVLLHDLGRWISHHPAIHDEIFEIIAHYMGLRTDLMTKQFDYHLRYYSKESIALDPEMISPEELIFFIADFMGKADDPQKPTDIRNFSNVFEYIIFRVKQYRKLEVSTIEEALEAMSGDQKTYYSSEVTMLKNAMAFFVQKGISLNEVRNNVQGAVEQSMDQGTLFSRRVDRLDQPLIAEGTYEGVVDEITSKSSKESVINPRVKRQITAATIRERVRAVVAKRDQKGTSEDVITSAETDLSNTHATRAAKASLEAVERLKANRSPLV